MVVEKKNSNFPYKKKAKKKSWVHGEIKVQ